MESSSKSSKRESFKAYRSELKKKLEALKSKKEDLYTRLNQTHSNDPKWSDLVDEINSTCSDIKIINSRIANVGINKGVLVDHKNMQTINKYI